MTKVTLHKVKRRGGAVWMLRWYDSQGQRPGATIGPLAKVTKRDAEAIRRDKQSKLDCGLQRPAKPRKMTLEEFLRRDREAVAIDLKPKTLQELRTVADHAMAALGPNFDVQKLDHAGVGRIKRYLADKKLAPATICKVVRHLQGAFTRGVRLGLVPANPFDGVKLPKVQRRGAKVFSQAEIDAMLGTVASGWWRCGSCGAAGVGPIEHPNVWRCPTILPDAERCAGKATFHKPSIWWEALIRLAYTSGLRLGELLNLTWSDLDLESSAVFVRPKKGGTITLAGKVYPILPWTSKSYENRTIPIPEETVTVLQRLRARSAGSPYVFIALERLAEIGAYLAAHDGKLDANYMLVSNLHPRFHVIQCAAAAKLAQGRQDAPKWERRSFHDLRRSYGTVMARHVPMHELKALMGHSSIRTTEEHYLATGDVSAKVRAAFGAASAVKAG